MQNRDFPREGEGSWADVPGTYMRVFAARRASEGGWVFKAYDLKFERWVARAGADSEGDAKQLAEQWIAYALQHELHEPLTWKACS